MGFPSVVYVAYPATDLVVVTVIDVKLVRLLYTAQTEGHEPIAKADERIKTVERLVKQKIVVKESRGQWHPSLQDEDVVTH